MVKHHSRRGVYQGCFSKWKKESEKHKWEMFAKCAPEMVKKCCEVPNAIREAFNMKVLKWNHGRFGDDIVLHSIPTPLALAVEQMVMDILATGQEVTTGYVRQLLLDLINIWNEHVHKLREKVEELVSASEKSADSDSPLKDMLDVLKKVDISHHKTTLKNLGLHIYI